MDEKLDVLDTSTKYVTIGTLSLLPIPVSEGGFQNIVKKFDPAALPLFAVKINGLVGTSTANEPADTLEKEPEPRPVIARTRPKYWRPFERFEKTYEKTT